jgi:hypothetical protein
MGGASSNGQAALLGEARLRAGVGGHQEIGASLYGAVAFENAKSMFGAKLTYKLAPTSFLAFVAGAGALTLDGKLRALGADLAVVVSPYTSRGGHRVYTGARGAFAVPILPGARGATEGLTLPLGVALRASENLRVFMEAGLLVGGAQYFSQWYSDGSSVIVGPYGAVGVELMIR